MRRLGGILALLLILVAAPAMAQRGPDGGKRGPDMGKRGPDVVLLGEKTVGFLVDRDVINISHNEEWFRNRSFSNLFIAVERNDVQLISLRVVYMNGFAEDIVVNKRIRPGDDLKIDLRGDRSFLRRIEMVYGSRPSFRGQAVVRVYGEPARRERPPRNPEWMLLGQKSVGFGIDRDIINVTHNEEWFRNRSFRSLHIAAERNDVHLMNVRVVYFNGFGEDIRVDKLIRAGSDLEIDLRGDRSFLRRIELIYRARPNFRGDAQVSVYGELAGRRR